MKHLRQEQGYAMLLVILTTVLISVIGLGLLTMNANSVKTSKNEEVDQAVYYIAEAGINLEKTKLREELHPIINNLIKELNTSIQNNEKLPPADRKTTDFFIGQFKMDFKKQSLNLICGNPSEQGKCISQLIRHQQFKEQFNKQPIADTQISVNCINTNECTFTIEATGYSDKSLSKKRSLLQELVINLDKSLQGTLGIPVTLPFDDMTIFTTDGIHTGGNATVNGFIGTTSGRGKITLGKNLDEGQIKNVDNYKDIDLNQYLPVFPEDKSATAQSVSSIPNPLKKDIYLKNLNLDNNELVIKLDDDVTLYVDSLESKNKAKLKIEGTGKLNIIIKEKFDFKGEFNPGGKISNVNIIYNGTDALTFKNEHSKIFGSMYIKNAAFSNNGASIHGNIYSAGEQTLNLTGNGLNTGQYIIAPNAKVVPSGGSVINGTIIAKELGGNGNYTISYPEKGEFTITLPTPTPENFLKEESMVEL